jgi:huntingtin-interacting protein 1-related protein
MKPEISMTSYELKVAEMDQQVRIVQLETALESARIKLGDLRKLSYANASMADQ